jgi:hypothetical protein
MLDYDTAFERLRSFLWLRRRRWKISVLFQILRIGHCSETYWPRCLPDARSLRTWLEAELIRGHHEDRIVNKDGISVLLLDERTWDAC